MQSNKIFKEKNKLLTNNTIEVINVSIDFFKVYFYPIHFT